MYTPTQHHFRIVAYLYAIPHLKAERRVMVSIPRGGHDTDVAAKPDPYAVKFPLYLYLIRTVEVEKALKEIVAELVYTKINEGYTRRFIVPCTANVSTSISSIAIIDASNNNTITSVVSVGCMMDNCDKIL